MRTRRSRFSGRIDELLPSLKTPEIESILGSEERIKNETIFATNLSEGTDVAGDDRRSLVNFVNSELSYINSIELYIIHNGI